MRSPHHRRSLLGRSAAGVLAAGVLGFGALSCRGDAPAEWRIGLVGVFEGPMAFASGVPAQNGARLAVDELNAAGGVLIDGRPHRVVLIERETAPRPDAAASTVRALINLDSVDVVIGPQTSNLAVTAGAVAEASGVPMITPMASNPQVTAGRRMVTRLAFVDAFQGEVLARFAAESLGVRRAAALHAASSEYGREITRLFQTTFERLGGTMVRVETFNADEPNDHSAQLRRIVAARPDAILLPSFVVHDSAQVRIARALGFRGVFLGSDAWDILTMAERRDALGSVVVANWDRRSTRATTLAFTRAWATRFDDRPRATAAATYDAVHLLALAAQRAGVRGGVALADSLRNFGAYDGAFTDYRFVGHGDPLRGAVLLEVDADSTRIRAFVPPAPR